MKIRLEILVLFLLVISKTLLAQNNTISNVTTIKLNNIGPILTKSEVTGYYLFYQTDRVNRKVYSYEIEILDQNLNKVSSKSLEGSKYLYLIDGVSNNKGLLLKFFDMRSYEVILRQYNNEAKEVSVSKRKTGQYERLALSQLAQGKEGQNVSLFPIAGKGFVDYRTEKNGKYGYVIDYYPSNSNEKKWAVRSEEKSKEHEFSTFVYGDENIIVSSVLTKNSVFSNSVDMKLLAINNKTGEKMYEKPITDPDYELFVFNGLESDVNGNLYLLGFYYPKGKNELSSPSLGLFEAKLDMKGNVLQKEFISWSEDVSQFLDVNAKGKIKDIGYIFFHDIIRNADGNIFAIGEQYKKQMNGINTSLVIQDLIILELTSDYKLKSVNIIDKQKSNFIFPRGFGINGAQILSYYAKYSGGFDYEFMAFNKDRSIFSVGYVDYVNVKGDDNKLVLGSITYTDSKPTKDLMDLKTVKEKQDLRVLPAKIGNVVIVEYFKKEKSLKMHIEKLNY